MSSYIRRKTPGDTQWFVNDRFGMFIHFGLYAMPARDEWIKSKELIPEERYQKYFDHFNPDLFNAKEWAHAAKRAGMKYAVITTKHHEGFCLFDSKHTDYKITNTPFKRDIVREYVDAFRAEGLKIGFYYSLIDGYHPDFRIDRFHPRRNDADAEQQDKNRDMHKYAQYMRDQVTELLTEYGKIDILWFDFSYTEYMHSDSPYYKPWMVDNGAKGKEQWEAEKLIATVRALQPNIIINNRTQLEQDLWTPEQFQPDAWIRHEKTGELVTWETCQTFSGTWGYSRDEYSWKSPEMLVNMLVNSVTYGGNLIMNVGPTSRGYFDHRAVEALAVYEEWMKYNSRSIYGCTMAEPEFTAPDGCKLTQSEDGKRLYIHLQTYPFKRIIFNNLSAEKIDYAQFLSDGSEIKFEERQAIGHITNGTGEVMDENIQSVVFNLPTVPPYGLCPVIEVFLK